MLKEIVNEINSAKEKLNSLIMIHGLSDRRVMKQSKKLDELIIKYYSAKKLKRSWIMKKVFNHKRMI